MSCPRCGAQVAPGAAFCTQCGLSLAAPAAPAAVAAPPPVVHVSGPGERSLHYMALSGVGCLTMVLAATMLLILVVEAHSFSALVVAMFMAVLPVPIYAMLILSLERHVREPGWLLAGAFFWGAVVAVMIAFFINTGASVVLSTVVGQAWANLIAPSLIAPVVEETSKGLALLLIFLFVRYQFNNMLDGIVLGALVGLGFAMTENVLYFARAYNAGGFIGVTVLFFVRVILNGFGHAMYTAATGAGLGLAEETTNPIVRVVAPILGYFMAMFLHFSWNTMSSLVSSIRAAPGIQLLVLVPAMSLFLCVPGVLVLIAIAVFAWRRETRIITAELQEEVARGVVLPGEYALLGNDRQRMRRVWHTLFSYGPLAWYLVRQFYSFEIALAFRKWHTERGERLPEFQQGLSEDAHRQHIVTLRARLHAMGVPTE